MIKTTMIHPWHLTTLKGHNFWWFPKPFRVLTILFCCVNDEIHLHKSTRILEERPDIVCLRSDQLRFSRRWNFKALSLLSLHGMEVELKSTKVDEYVVQKKTHQGDVTCDNLGKLLRRWYSSSCDIDILLAAVLCNWNFSYQNVLSPRQSESLCSTICAVFFFSCSLGVVIYITVSQVFGQTKAPKQQHRDALRSPTWRMGSPGLGYVARMKPMKRIFGKGSHNLPTLGDLTNRGY